MDAAPPPKKQTSRSENWGESEEEDAATGALDLTTSVFAAQPGAASSSMGVSLPGSGPRFGGELNNTYKPSVAMALTPNDLLVRRSMQGRPVRGSIQGRSVRAVGSTGRAGASRCLPGEWQGWGREHAP